MSPSKKVLLVENNPADVRLIREAFRELQRSELELDVARDGQEGFERLTADGSYGLVLLDIRMPRLSGVEVLERLGPQVANHHVVMLTTTRSSIEHERCLALGARSVRVKPSDFDDLCDMLQEILP